MSPKPGEASRRFLLFAAAGAVTPKMTQAAAAYQPTPKGGLRCAGCTFFRKPRACQVVEGDISPSGWCRLFDLPD